MKRSLIDARFKKNLLFSYMTQLASIGAGFISLTIITRYAGIDIYGRVAMMTALAGVATNLMTFRTNEAVINFYKRGQVENNLGLCRLALIAGLSLDLVMGGLLVLLMKILAPVIAESLLKQSDMEAAVVIFSGIMLATFLRGTAFGLLVAEERFRFINSLNVVEQILKALLLTVVVYMGVKLTFERVIWAMLIPTILITSIVYVLPLRKLLGNLRAVQIQGSYVREYARFSLSTFFSSTLKAGNQNIDTIFLGYLTNPTNVGIYNLFKQFLSPMNMIAGPYSAQIYPRFVEAMVDKNSEAVRQTISHASGLLAKKFFMLVVVIVPALIIYVQWNKLGLSYKEYFVFAVMAVSTFVIQQLWWSRSFSMSTNPDFSIRAGLLATFLMIALLPALISTLGLLGAAVGYLIVQLLLRAFWTKMLREAI